MLGSWLVLSLLLTAVYAAFIAVPSSSRSHSSRRYNAPQSEKPDVYSLHIRSHIQHRYASTVVSSRVANPANKAQEIFFSFVMPETAFISGFLMEIDGVEYKAHVREKEEAKREYTQAVSQGLAAAHVAQSTRNSDRFTVSVNVEPLKKVTFNLTYEELLKRQLSFYTHTINIDPGQIVRDLSVEVFINESSPIKAVHVPLLKESNEIDPQGFSEEDPFAEIDVSSPNSATVRWAPTEKQQRSLKAEGIKGQLSVRYDLDRTTHPEQILVNEGYFVHFFSPEDLVPLPKHVIFVMDISGSMSGRKIRQLREAMVRILSDLSPADFFSFVTFSTDVKVWDVERHLKRSYRPTSRTRSRETVLRNSTVVAATPDNINKAKEFIGRLHSRSLTNIHGALMKGVDVALLGKEIIEGGPEPMIIFLTDGEANIGESNTERIVASVTEENDDGVAIFGLAFGDDANLPLLKKLSLKNSGFARKIYEASDAALQLQDFYRQVSSPLLANVTFKYTENQVEEESLSSTKFNTLFRGSELVVSGKLTSDNVSGVVTARGSNGFYILDFSPVICLEPEHYNSTPSFMERLWGYLTIQQLLERETAGSGNSSALRQRALELALRFSFVTPLTSLVVVKPNDISTVNAEEGSDTADTALNQGQLLPSSNNHFNFPHSIQSDSGSYGPFTLQTLSSGGYGSRMSGRHTNQPYSSSVVATPDTLDSSLRRRLIMDPYSSNHPRSRLGQHFYNPPRASRVYSSPFVPADVNRGHYIVSLDSVSWLNRTDDTSSITIPPETFLVKLTNQTNEAYNACNTTQGGPGHCRHLVNCALIIFQTSFHTYLPFFCRIENNYAGVCCPDSLQSVSDHS